MRSLRGRLGVALALTALGSVVLMAVLSFGLLRRSAVDRARTDLRRVAAVLAGDPGTLGDERLGLQGVRRVLAIHGDVMAVVFDGGRMQGDGATVARIIDLSPLLRGEQMTGSVRAADGEYVYVAVPVSLARRALARGVVLARPLRLARDFGVSGLARIGLAALVAMVAALGVSGLIARRLVAPVGALSTAVKRITRGHLGEQVPVDSDDEIGALATAFNEMSVALGEAQRREREFLGSVSHELRTPITAIRGYAEALADGAVHGDAGREEAVAIIRAEADRLERMVSDVMDLARLGQREFALEVRSSDLARELSEAVAAFGAPGADVAVTCDAPDAVVVHTDPDRVRQVVSNLVQNALRVTPVGGSVVVRVRRAPPGAQIEVADTGPGIAPEDLPHVFERSYLWRASKGTLPVGTGLGLAIVRELVARLGGNIEVASEPGRGTTFRISLPDRARADA